MQRTFLFILLFLLTSTICLAQEDVTPPSFTALNPPNGTVITNSYVNITGSVDDATAVVDVDDLSDLGGFVLDSDPLNFSFLIPLKPGTNTFLVDATDEVGNFASTSVTVDYASLQNNNLNFDIRWFTPNIKSVDMRDFFRVPSGWNSARGKTKVFKFYGVQLRPSCPTNVCGENKLENFIQDGAFSQLNTWQKKIAFEEPPLTPGFSCDQNQTVSGTRLAMQKVSQNGHQVSYIAMDSPHRYGVECGLNNNTIADKIKNWITQVKAAPYQSVVIGEIEPYPYFSLAQHQAWLQTYFNRVGSWPPFYHVDIDPGANLNSLSSDLAALKTYCEARAIKLGVLIYGGEPPLSDTNQEYYNVAMNTIIPKVRTGINVPPHTQFQSYAAGGTLPSNLTECSFFTHSNLVNDGYGKLEDKGDWAKFVTKSHPASMVKNTTANVSVTMRNKGGGTTWYPGDYFLVPAGPNIIWGVSEVSMPSPCLGPYASNQNNTKQFNFVITAPSTTGCYKFRWKMMHVTDIGDIKFGVASPDVCINVTN